MAYETYRVRKEFGWNGWTFAPNPGGGCECRGIICGFGASCTLRVGTGCGCDKRVCRCSCRIPENLYGGDIWFIEAGDPRKAAMLGRRFAVGDPTIPTVDDLLKQPECMRLLSPPQEPARRRKLIPAGSR